ncbi:hypothetical protein [Mesorhizobium sp.]|jgi:hypothetical protein|uniref:hypothetical protein n=1 Tax=Mesorhizobium sp. TaxID=1871066 RepID=UPI003566F33F
MKYAWMSAAKAWISAAIGYGGGTDYLRPATWFQRRHLRPGRRHDLAVLRTILLLLLLVLLPLYPVLQDLQVILLDQRVAGGGIEDLRGSGHAYARQRGQGQQCRCGNYLSKD